MNTRQQQLALQIVGGASQRWCNRKVRYRPPGEVFEPRFAEVVPIEESRAREFTLRHHYSQSYPAARFRAGIFVKKPFRPEFLGGTAVFSVPMTDAVITRWLEVDDPRCGIELGRLVLLDHDDLQTNAESWFVARAFKLLKRALPELKGVVAFCDPVARVDTAGRVRKPVHSGVIYHALNGVYRGTTSARTHLVAQDGWVASPRALSKIRNGETGAAYALRQLEQHGAPRRRMHEDGAAYITRLRSEAYLRSERHPGCLGFVFKPRQWLLE